MGSTAMKKQTTTSAASSNPPSSSVVSSAPPSPSSFISSNKSTMNRKPTWLLSVRDGRNIFTWIISLLPSTFTRGPAGNLHEKIVGWSFCLIIQCRMNKYSDDYVVLLNWNTYRLILFQSFSINLLSLFWCTRNWIEQRTHDWMEMLRRFFVRVHMWWCHVTR